jgi:hypothetical protein
LSPRTKKAISISVKIAILILAFAFIFHKLNDNQKIADFKRLINQLPLAEVYEVLFVVFFLMLLNWFLEALKWMFLMRNIEELKLGRAVESVFCGLTWAIFTPNRIGEYGGRVFFLAPRKRVQGIIAMAVGAIGQMTVTNVLGAWALLWFVGAFVPLNISLHYAIAFLVVVFCTFFLLFFFNIRWMLSLLNSIAFLKRFRKFFSIIARYRKNDLVKIFSFSLARFAVFTTQYCLIIHLLLPDLAIFEIIMMVLILLFIQSALPSLDLLDVGVRGMTATYFFGYITDQHVAIIAATTCIWLINLIIPAIIGAPFVFKLNFFGTNRN